MSQQPGQLLVIVYTYNHHSMMIIPCLRNTELKGGDSPALLMTQ